MSTDTIIQFRPLVPGGDLIYMQTPTPIGLVTQETNAEDSWDLAEEQAKQAQENDLAAAAVDDDSSSTHSSTISDTSIESSDETSSDTSSSSASASASAASAPSRTTSSAARGSTTNTVGSAASGANRMTAAVPANPSSLDRLRASVRASVRTYHVCACISTVLLGTGAVFTLLANKVIQHRDSGYVYPEEIEFDKVMAWIWYGAGAIAGGIGVANAVYHYRRGNN